MFVTSSSCNAPRSIGTSDVQDQSAWLQVFNFVPASTRFEVQYRPQGSLAAPISVTFVTTTPTFSVTTRGVLVTGLTASTVYEFRVRMLCDGGVSSAFTNYTSFTTLCASPTATLSNIGTQTITVGQTATLTAMLTGVGPWSLTLSNGQSFSNVVASPFAFTVAPALTTIYILSRVSNFCGTGTVSGTAVVTIITPTATCLPVTRLDEYSISPTKAILEWDNPDNNPKALRIRQQGASTWTVYNLLAGTGIYSVTALTAGMVYEWQLATTCPDGTVAVSNTRSFAVQCTPPNVNYFGRMPTDTRALVTWPAQDGYAYMVRFAGGL